MDSAPDQSIQGAQLKDFSPDLIRPTPGAVLENRTAQIECTKCLRPLPLRLSRRGETAAKWRCRICELAYVAVCSRPHLARQSATIVLDELHFDVSDCPDLSTDMHELAAKMAETQQRHVSRERRRSRRVSQSLVVPGVCLDKNLSPDGSPFKTMVANISREGIGLLHSDLIRSEEIALELAPGRQDTIQVIVRIVRERLVAERYYEFGGIFEARLGGFGG